MIQRYRLHGPFDFSWMEEADHGEFVKYDDIVSVLAERDHLAMQVSLSGGDSMDLISCNQCGIVLDKDKTIFPDVYDHDTQDIIIENAEWDGKDYVSKVDCPVCSGAILER